MNPIVGFFIALALVLANAFFVASEFALVSLDRSQLDMLDRPRRVRLINGLLDRLTFHLSSAQFGITLSALMLGFVIEPILAQLIEPLVEPLFGESASHGIAIGLSLAVATAVHLVLGEQIPKLYSIGQPLRTITFLSPAMRIFSTLVGPITWLLNNLAERAVRLVGLSPSTLHDSVVSVEDLEYVFKTSGKGGTLDPEDVELLTASLKFGTKTAANVYVPRMEVVAVGKSATAADLAELSLETGFSRFPVVDDTEGSLNLDSIVGLVHVKSVFEVPPHERTSKPIAEFCSEVFAVPPQVALQSLLGQMGKRHFQMAVVLDEHGGMAGIVTFENIVEKLVGEIVDEYDEEIQPAEGGSSDNVISGLLRADEVLAATGFAMPPGDYETIAGLILHELERIPAEGEIIFINGWRWEVAEMDEYRIAWLKYRPSSLHDSQGPREFSMTALQLILAAFFIAANGFFVAVEFSLVATPRSALDRLAQEGNRRARIALASTGDLGRQLAGAQFGITITSLALGYIAESAIANVVQDIFKGLGSAITHGVAGAIALGTMVVLQMLLGEMIPKNAAIAVPVRMTLWIAPPHRLFVAAFRPVISLINWLGSQGVAMLGVTPPTEVDETRTPAELASMLERSRRQGGIDDTEHDLLTGALDFGEQTVASHLVPRPQVVSARRNSTVAELEQLLVTSGHSRLPLYSQSLEDAVSFVHAKDLLRIEESARNSQLPSSLVRPLPSVSSGELLEDVLVKMRRESQHIALVRVNDGTVAGLITLEDVLEALIGEIEDESDKSKSDSGKI